MTKRDFKASMIALAALCFAATTIGGAVAQTPAPAVPKMMRIGDILSGELTAMRQRAPKGKRINTYQLVSEPRRLPPPAGLCNLETGPETFQIVTADEAQAAQLKALIGKQIALKVAEVACAAEAGQMSEAVVTKWSVVAKPN
jgi:hypothetical protein